ncbi:2'-5' RNA ligase family protein [Agromyces sp. G08B096]|uniref:2'-5' RNA ligase family protein n=1 Tax=Agromyces sp. G08B096 TaxID=3156399 RepID=A0AAU7W4I4_9MICO
MARFVVVLPVAPLEAGAEFEVADWPLHVTLVEPFDAADIPGTRLAAALDAVARAATPIRATAGGDAWFGRRHDVPVTLVVDGSGAIARLRSAAVDAIRATGIRLDVRQDFRPHVTAKPHGRLHQGAAVLLDRIALVDQRPARGAGHRLVEAVVSLAGADRA